MGSDRADLSVEEGKLYTFQQMLHTLNFVLFQELILRYTWLCYHLVPLSPRESIFISGKLEIGENHLKQVQVCSSNMFTYMYYLNIEYLLFSLPTNIRLVHDIKY